MSKQIHERLLIIDFGSQVTKLIARRVRESGVYCEVHPYNKITDAVFRKLCTQSNHPLGRDLSSVGDGCKPAYP